MRDRDIRQLQLMGWATNAFGKAEATSLTQRALRLLEEATEAFQAAGGDQSLAELVVHHVFGRPRGELAQELGGVAVTLLVLAEAAKLSAEEEERRECDRVMSKPAEHWRARNEAKKDAGLVADPLSQRIARHLYDEQAMQDAARRQVAAVLNDTQGFHIDDLDEETRADFIDRLIKAALPPVIKADPQSSAMPRLASAKLAMHPENKHLCEVGIDGVSQDFTSPALRDPLMESCGKQAHALLTWPTQYTMPLCREHFEKAVAVATHFHVVIGVKLLEPSSEE